MSTIERKREANEMEDARDCSVDKTAKCWYLIGEWVSLVPLRCYR